MELLLVFWCLIWAIICALIGARKGAAFFYFFLGLILGPIGVIIALVGKGNRVKCPFCRKLIDPKATVCAYCQKEIIYKNEVQKIESSEHRAIRKFALLFIIVWFALVCIFPRQFIMISLLSFMLIFGLTIYNRKFAN